MVLDFKDAVETNDLAMHQSIEAQVKPDGYFNAASNLDPERRKEVEKSMLRKLDARCSLFVLIYIMNYLDRNNIAAARLKGLQEDLSLTNTQYSTCLSILVSLDFSFCSWTGC